MAKTAPPLPDDLLQAARHVRDRAYAPYSRFKVGAAVRGANGVIYTGCNVENVAYPEGTCAEAGALARMVAEGETRFHEVLVIADSPQPVTPCGGCRQKLAEFAASDAVVHMTTLNGEQWTARLADLLPGAFDTAQMSNTQNQEPAVGETGS